MQFMDKDFLLKNEVAKTLFHTFAEKASIYDFHCHLSPIEIAEDKCWSNMTEIWLSGDHYKWRLLRANGVDERFITGNASDYEKFEKFAELMPRLIGNPIYHWTHLELQRYFGVNEPLSGESCRGIWDECNTKLKNMSARSIIKDSGVRLICTTDDPCDTLEYHQKIALDTEFDVAVQPSWRPDKAVGIDKGGFAQYIEKLSQISGIQIDSMDTLKEALEKRIEFFHRCGCRNSDHGLDYVVYPNGGNPEAALKKALAGEAITREEADSYKAALLLYLAGKYVSLGWAMQIHYGVTRNNNLSMFSALGPDTGYDAMHGGSESGYALGKLLGRMEAAGNLPKTIVYSIDPSENAIIDTVIGCFQTSEARMKLQHGSAWWFNDSKRGMEEHLSTLASLSVLSNFVGMVTDSRSFLSYTRHEYFRRILCNLLGTWVENGEYPADLETLGGIVEDICGRNANRYFA